MLLACASRPLLDSEWPSSGHLLRHVKSGVAVLQVGRFRAQGQGDPCQAEAQGWQEGNCQSICAK